MKKKIQFLLLLLALLLPATAIAHDFEVDGIYYLINGNEVAVTYRGTSSYQYSNEYSGSVTIPSTVSYNGTTYSVTAIGGYAFYNCSGLTSVTIANSVTSIANSAFLSCSGLTSITVASGNPIYDSRGNSNAIIETATNILVAGCKNSIIPNSVTSIGESAFSYCIGLTSITIPNSVIAIGDFAFYECIGLTSVSIGNSVTTIGNNAFRSCSSLTSITIPNSVTTIGSGALDGTAWYDNQPDGLVYAGLVAYRYKGTMPNGTNIIIRDGTLGIASNAFGWCEGLASVTIPNSVTYIGNDAFYACVSLTNVNIPNSVTSIGSQAFTFTSLTSINIPNSVTSIGIYAFALCKCLTSIHIPNSVSSIGDYAFGACSSLTNITVDIGNSNYDSRNNCNAIIETTSNTLITGCMNTVIPNSVTNIGAQAFECCTGLTSITIPNSVITIGENAFDYCENLTSVIIGNSVTSIGRWAFGCCDLLDEVYSFIYDPNSIMIGDIVFKRDSENYSSRILHVPYGSTQAYQADSRWSDYFGYIVEMELVPIESIQLNVTTAGLNEGATLQLSAMVQPEEGTSKKMNWASSNPSIATVDNNGLVTTHGVGTATITAMTTDGSNLSASCVVTLLPVGVKGDVNDDGRINISDVSDLIDILLNGN